MKQTNKTQGALDAFLSKASYAAKDQPVQSTDTVDSHCNNEKNTPVAAATVKVQPTTDSTNKTTVNNDQLPLSERLGVQNSGHKPVKRNNDASTDKMMKEISNMKLKMELQGDKESNLDSLDD